MKRYTIDELKTKFAELGYTWYPFMLVGIRSQANIPNEFDDLVGVVEGVGVTGKQEPEMTRPFKFINGFVLSMHTEFP